jgi:hypothetical protein
VNLDDIYSTSTTRAAYVPIGKAKLEPDSLLARYLLTDNEYNMKDPLLFARYAPGYLGEHGEREQLGKLVLGEPDRYIAPYYLFPLASDNLSWRRTF